MVPSKGEPGCIRSRTGRPGSCGLGRGPRPDPRRRRAFTPRRRRPGDLRGRSRRRVYLSSSKNFARRVRALSLRAAGLCKPSGVLGLFLVVLSYVHSGDVGSGPSAGGGQRPRDGGRRRRLLGRHVGLRQSSDRRGGRELRRGDDPVGPAVDRARRRRRQARAGLRPGRPAIRQPEPHRLLRGRLRQSAGRHRRRGLRRQPEQPGLRAGGLDRRQPDGAGLRRRQRLRLHHQRGRRRLPGAVGGAQAGTRAPVSQRRADRHRRPQLRHRPRAHRDRRGDRRAWASRR